MSSRRREARPARRVWVFSEPNPALQPSDLARLIAREAIRAAQLATRADAKPTPPTEKEQRDES